MSSDEQVKRATNSVRDPKGGNDLSPKTSEIADLPLYLAEAIQIVNNLGKTFEPDRSKLLDLSTRLEEGRFHLAVLGQFKRGKSTFLNALLGERLLPMSIVPLTSIPTFILPDNSRHARVCYLDGRTPIDKNFGEEPGELIAFLTRFVTEESNPNNVLGVSYVEVFHTAPILKKGVVFIDTPGIGSTFRHNTEATLNFLSQCDAALFLISADPPITEVEVEFLKEVKLKVSRLFFILNKSDYLSEYEKALALEFINGVLKKQVGMPAQTIFSVSAKAGLQAAESGDRSKWEESGMAEIERYLVDFLVSEKTHTLSEAVEGKAAAIIDRIQAQTGLFIQALRLPIDELEKRLLIFQEEIREIQRQKLIVGDILAGDKRRVDQYVEEKTEQLRKDVRMYLEGILIKALATPGLKSEYEAAQEALDAAIPGFFEHEFGVYTRDLSNYVTEILKPHQGKADELIEKIRKNAAEIFEIPYHAPESTEAFEISRNTYWITHKWMTSIKPVPSGLFDTLMPASIRRTQVTKRVLRELDELIIRNVENLRWPLVQSLDNAFRNFSSDLDDRLEETIAATYGAIQSTTRRRKEQSESVSAQIEKYESVTSNLTAIREKLKQKME
ncbi:MAG: dynamin family protein [Deltaproteobacteria bacterium]|nr:dynamin family protein [Candidatus Zymogenaceae bacterium]